MPITLTAVSRAVQKPAIARGFSVGSISMCIGMPLRKQKKAANGSATAA